MKTLMVMMAGAVGALARYRIGLAFGGRSFPYATLGINLTGSALLGLVMAISIERGWSDTATVPLAIGLIGAYTTFSTFSYETFDLTRNDRTATAVLYVTVSVVGGVLAAAAAYFAGRRLA